MGDPTIEWLLAGDPAIVWQSQRDLLDAPDHVSEPARARVTDEGWGRRLLDLLEGLLEWKRRRRTTEADDAIATGHEFMLAHRMFRSHTTGEVISERWTRFSFPPRWHYDVLRGLDHLREAGAERDPRVGEAIELVEGRRRSNGRWPVGPRHPGARHFTMEDGRQPGRWNTLRALRVLKWWES